MSYTWTDGELITATKLNNTGAPNALICEASFDGDGYILNKTTQEIYDALLADIPVYIKFQYGQLDQSYEGTIYLAPIIKIYNYAYTNNIRICASKPQNIGSKNNTPFCFSPAILIFQSASLEDYPILLTTVYSVASSVDSVSDIK